MSHSSQLFTCTEEKPCTQKKWKQKLNTLAIDHQYILDVRVVFFSLGGKGKREDGNSVNWKKKPKQTILEKVFKTWMLLAVEERGEAKRLL